MDAVVRLQPTSVLDIGPGYGKWGLLIREALDFMHGRHKPEEFQVRIEGLEAFEGYSSPLYGWVYDEVRNGDVASMVEALPAYDLVVMGDVIEHMPKEVGLRVLRSLLKTSRNVIVTTPSEFFEQEVPDNPWESHKSVWTREDFAEWPYDFQLIGMAFVAVLGGRGSNWPTLDDAKANNLAYRIPWLNRGAIRPQLVKTALRRTLFTSTS
jgi:hypothetical protein